MKQLKHKLLFLTIATVSILPLAVASSCDKKLVQADIEQNLEENYASLRASDYHNVGRILYQNVENPIKDKFDDIIRVKRTLWEKFNYIEGKIKNIIDGDTIDIEVTQQPRISYSGKEIIIPSTIKIRIPMIDTLEENTPEVKEREKSLAHIDSDYARKLLPAGTKVRVVSENWTNKSYNRHVGSIFFGEKYEKNFAIEMLAAGYTLARIPEDAISDFKYSYEEPFDNDKNLYTYLLPYAAYAMNDAIINKRGFYGEFELFGKKEQFNGPYDFAKEYLEHGEEIISTSRFIMHPKLWRNVEPDAKNNIYKFVAKYNKENSKRVNSINTQEYQINATKKIINEAVEILKDHIKKFDDSTGEPEKQKYHLYNLQTKIEIFQTLNSIYENSEKVNLEILELQKYLALAKTKN
ncbi:thermonuclease family protein [Metamycoplasma equirhinis]|uniref:thermonuclease family protein n=1 Tax=Metamycoplasma equirhinis TaxID=92402 RepID=UPI00359C9053